MNNKLDLFNTLGAICAPTQRDCDKVRNNNIPQEKRTHKPNLAYNKSLVSFDKLTIKN